MGCDERIAQGYDPAPRGRGADHELDVSRNR